MHDYVQEKREEHRRKKGRKLRLVVGIIFILILASGIIWFFRSSWYTVQAVHVEQLDSTLSSQVSDSVFSAVHDRSWVSSILLNQNSFIGFGGHYLEQKISESYPVLTDVSVSKNYITRIITVTARERTKDALWCNNIDTCWWFDDTGVVFLEAPIAQGQLIKKVIASSTDTISIGQQIPLDYTNISYIFSFLDAIHAPGRSLLWDAAHEELSTETHKGFPTIYFSTRQDPAYALAAIQKISNLDRLSYIDLRITNRIYYR